jgi:alanine dehydrogenase
MESWRNRKTLILSRTDMTGLLTPAEYNDCVEHAFRMHGLGRVYMEPKGHIVLDRYPGEWEVMPSYIEEYAAAGSPEGDVGAGPVRPEAAACKWVSIREDNAKFDLPTVFSILVYTHPETGFPLAICDGSHHTMMRTGSSAAVSAKWLARKDSKVLAIVGAGTVGRGVLATCEPVFPWEEVRVWSRSQATVDRFLAEQAPQYPQLRVRGSTDLEQTVRGADVVVAGTHARGWIVDDAWVAPGTHLAALGADLKGEQELDPRILQRARIFVDDIRQCRTDGEINVPLREGLLREEDVAGEIGKVICGELEGRQSDDQITVFDSTGIALQDSATVTLEYERAVAAGVGIEKKMIST